MKALTCMRGGWHDHHDFIFAFTNQVNRPFFNSFLRLFFPEKIAGEAEVMKSGN